METYQVDHYNLDVIISVGYRVKSKRGTQFRQWATQRLKDYLIKGFSVNHQRLEQLKQSFKLIREAALTEDLSQSQVKEIIDVLSDYALGLDILDGYDKQNLEIGYTDENPIFQINYKEAKHAITDLREKFGGSPLFGNEKDDSFKSSIIHAHILSNLIPPFHSRARLSKETSGAQCNLSTLP